MTLNILVFSPKGVIEGEVSCPQEEQLMRDIRDKTTDIFIMEGGGKEEKRPTWVVDFLKRRNHPDEKPAA